MANHIIDLAGRQVGLLRVLDHIGINPRGSATWRVLCTKCEHQFVRSSKDLQRLIRCCCKNKHGHCGTRAYLAWTNMHSRCRDKCYRSFHRYGGRGIRVCRRWSKFENFLTDMGEPPKGHSLERKNNDGHYEPHNCRWATSPEQSRNRTGVQMITYQGRTMCLKDWASELGINYATLRFRVTRRGWPVEVAFNWKKGKWFADRRERARNSKGQYTSKWA